MKKTLLAEVLAIALLFCINNKTFMKKYIIIYALLLFSFVHTNAQSWLLTGNSGTKSTNFLGTTDDKALVFRTNNVERMRVLSSGNTGIGTNNPHQKLDVSGNINIKKGFGLYMGNHRVLIADTTSLNIFLGNGVGFNNTTGSLNTVAGSMALSANTSGYANTAAGAYALYLNQTGSYNTAYGAYTLYSNTASYNTAAGNYSLYFNTTGEGNTAYGYASLYNNTYGYKNVAVGRGAMYVNQIGGDNVAVGESALYYSQGHSNTAIGSSALFSTSDAYGANTAVGDHALYSANSSFNTAVGSYVLYKSTTGSHNVAMGYGTMGDNTTGDFNTAIGTFALDRNVTGRYNAGVGNYALFFTTNSWGNAALGYGAGQSYDNGYYNTFIGSYTDATVADIYNSTALGNSAIVSAPGQVRIGNSLVGSIGGYANWSNISDGRVKKNMQENVPGLAFVNKLRPITYNLDLDAADRILQPAARKDKDGRIVQPSKEEINARNAKQQVVYTGFVAQDVERAAKELNYNFSGVDAAKNDKDLYALRYAEFVVPLVKAVQELSAQNNELKSRIEKLEAILSQNAAGNTSASIQGTIKLNEVSLLQNTPNPFNRTTTIPFMLPQQYQSAKIIITDNNGKTIKEVNLSGSGKSCITVDASSIAAGVYDYSMYIDGKQVQSKKMILNK